MKPLYALALITALAATLRAADPAPPPLWPIHESKHYLHPVITEESRQLLARLASDNFATREAASAELAARGPAAFPGFEELALTSPDPEIQSRIVPFFPPKQFRIPSSFPVQLQSIIDEYAKLHAKFASELKSTPAVSASRVFAFDP